MEEDNAPNQGFRAQVYSGIKDQPTIAGPGMAGRRDQERNISEWEQCISVKTQVNELLEKSNQKPRWANVLSRNSTGKIRSPDECK